VTNGGEIPNPDSSSGQAAEDKEERKPGSRSGRFWTAIGIPVLVLVLASWLTPLPHVIAKMFQSHHGSPAQTSSPLTAAVQEDVGPCGHAWIVAKPRGAVPTPPTTLTASAWTPWIRKAKAIETSYTDVIVTIQARPGQVVYLTGFEFDVSKRQPPLHGTTVAPACGGPVLGRFVSADLDSSPPRIIATSSDPTAVVGGLNATPLKLPYEVTYRDGLVLILDAQVKKYDCTWSADIMWASGGRTGDLVIDENGAPFQTTPWVANQKAITVYG
jgi:hypothetical protein